jgi:glycosyltransferase involved in cell wall biosynthesis
MIKRMRCPTLADLPPPPAGRTGWPWTEESAPLPQTRPDGAPWPRISIVTPSFNQGGYIEETIRSVLLQGYPDLEYIIMDGGSSDETVEVIRRYEPWIASWRSEKDGGQADAVNAGLALCTGEIFQFINSDDVVARDAMGVVGAMPSEAAGIAGSVIDRYPDRDAVWRNTDLSVAKLLRPRQQWHQPGVWLRTEAVRRVGGFDASYWYYFDLKFMLKFLEHYETALSYTDAPLVIFRQHDESKSGQKDLAARLKVREAVRAEEMRFLTELGAEFTDPRLRRLAPRAARERAWVRTIDATCESDQPRLAKAASLALGALGDPSIRFSRRTGGMIRDLLFKAP